MKQKLQCECLPTEVCQLSRIHVIIVMKSTFPKVKLATILVFVLGQIFLILGKRTQSEKNAV